MSAPCALKKRLQMARLLHFVYFLASLLELYVLYVLRKDGSASQMLGSITSYALFLAGIYCLIGPPLFARRIVRKTIPELQHDPSDPKALKRWTIAAIVNSCACNACVLFGWILCFMGTPLTWTYTLLWSLAAIGFIIFIPQMPVDEMTMMQHNPPPGP